MLLVLSMIGLGRRRQWQRKCWLWDPKKRDTENRATLVSVAPKSLLMEVLVLGALLEAPSLCPQTLLSPSFNTSTRMNSFNIFCGFPLLTSAMKLLWRLLLCDLLFCCPLLVFYIQCNKTMVVDFSNYEYEYDIRCLELAYKNLSFLP